MNKQNTQFTYIFNEALDLPKAQRQAYVDKMCGTNTTLHQRLLDLLDSAEEASAFFNDLQAEMYTSLVTQEALTGTELLNYKIGEKLGEGGMATVYKAQRIDGLYEGEVAFKVFDKGTHHPELASRFEYERKILASLNHPNITPIIDAGVTPQGVPFYLLEYIDGQNILNYVRQNQLSLRQTLTLFLKIAEAVQHAHQNFIIHRDIKPANVLVNSQGEPKLLDFGIAKVLEESSLPGTETQALLLTPDYASPEQLTGQNITTATDVYLLGLLLYELITFEKPFDTVKKGILKIQQERQQKTVVAPLKRLNQHHLSRNTTGVSSDLNAIVLKTLAYEPKERYHNVQSLIDDIEALLAHQPIKARPANWVYKAQKYLQRNPAIVGLSSLLVIASFVFALVYVININQALAQAKEATQTAKKFQKKAEGEAKVSKQVSGFLQDFFISGHPDIARGKPVTVKQILKNGFKRVKKTTLAPEIKARLLLTLSKTFRGVSEFVQSNASIEQAIHLAEDKPLDNPLLLSELYYQKAVVCRNLEKTDSAIVYARKSIRLLEDIPSKTTEESKMLGKVYSQLAFIYSSGGKNIDEALILTKKSLALQQKVYDGPHYEIVGTLFVLAKLYRGKKDYKTGEAYQRKSLAMCQEIYKDPHPCATANLNDLSYFLRKQKKYKEAIEALEKSLNLSKQLHGEKHREIAVAHFNIGRTYQQQKQYDKARMNYTKALAMYREIFGEEYSLYAFTQAGICQTYIEEKKNLKQAIELLKKTIALNQKKKRKSSLASNHYFLGQAYTLTQQYPLAEPPLQKALQYYTDKKSFHSLAKIRYAFGELFYQQKKYPQAETWFLKTIQDYELKKITFEQVQPTLEALVKLYDKTQRPAQKAKFERLLTQQL